MLVMSWVVSLYTMTSSGHLKTTKDLCASTRNASLPHCHQEGTAHAAQREAFNNGTLPTTSGSTLCAGP